MTRITCVYSFLLLLSFLRPQPILGQTVGTLAIIADTTLTENHEGNIIIVVNDVTLDCDGFPVSGTGSGEGIALVGRTEVTVKNCQVTNFSTSFFLGNSDGNVLTDNTSIGSRGIGFNLNSSDGNTLIGNTANDSEQLDGFRVEKSSGNTLIGNTANDNRAFGFQLQGAPGGKNNLLTGNTASGNVAGFGLRELSNDNVLTDNTASGNLSGFLLSTSNGNILTGNTAEGNVDGFAVSGSSVGNTITGNAIIRNDHGFHICRSSLPPHNKFIPNMFTRPQRIIHVCGIPSPRR